MSVSGLYDRREIEQRAWNAVPWRRSFNENTNILIDCVKRFVCEVVVDTAFSRTNQHEGAGRRRARSERFI